MYILVLGAVLLSSASSPWSGAAAARRRLIGHHLASPASASSPDCCCGLVPRAPPAWSGSVQTPLAAGVVQVRGALVVALAVFLVLTRTRRAARASQRSRGPALYNSMAYEASRAVHRHCDRREMDLRGAAHHWRVGFVLLTIFPRAAATAGGGSSRLGSSRVCTALTRY